MYQKSSKECVHGKTQFNILLYNLIFLHSAIYLKIEKYKNNKSDIRNIIQHAFISIIKAKLQIQANI